MFFRHIADGYAEDASGPNDPRLKLRERLQTNRSDKAKIHPAEIAAQCVKAWNAYRLGRDVIAMALYRETFFEFFRSLMRGADAVRFKRAVLTAVEP